MAEAAGIFYGIETMVEGAVAAAKGIYDPTLPLKANLIPIKDVHLPRAYHSVSVIKGRAYIFGGKEDGGKLADNAMHIIILPSSGIESTDYKRLEPTSSSPPARYGHSAATIDDQIYMFGGSDSNGTLEEKGRVWVFDTTTNSWSSFDAQTKDIPEGRSFAAATGTEQPQPEHHRTDENVAPQLPPDPAKMVPEPLAPSSYGTFIVYGGITAKDNTPSPELWAFDMSSKTWAQLPSPPSTYPPVQTPSITIIQDRLYAITGTETHMLLLDLKSSYNDQGGIGTLGLSPMKPWSKIGLSLTTSTTSTTSKTPTPSPRSAATLTPITTGQGRNYLLLLGGSDISSPSTTHQDIWSLQLQPTGMTAASFKDAARMSVKKDTEEESWAELKYYNAENVMVQESQQGRGIGCRKGFAAAKSRDIDGGTVFVWGGEEDGVVRGDGLLVEVEK